LKRRLREEGDSGPSYTVKDLPADERPRERLLRGSDPTTAASVLTIAAE
jgi:hypothetical protein